MIRETLDDMKSAMTNIITLAKTKADLVVIFDLPPHPIETEKQRDYSLWLPEHCAEQNVQYFSMVDVLGTGGGPYGQERNYNYYGSGDPGFPDALKEVHPNPLGHQALSQALQAQMVLPESTKYFGEYIRTEEFIHTGDE